MLKLTADARKALLTSATEEAMRRGDRRLGTDHLLLALLRDPDSPTARALGVSLGNARSASAALDRAALAAVGIEARQLASPRQPATVRRLPPLTSGARAVITGAVEAARLARTGRIETRHFLLALLTRELPDPAAQLLRVLGVDPAEVRRRLAGTAA